MPPFVGKIGRIAPDDSKSSSPTGDIHGKGLDSGAVHGNPVVQRDDRTIRGGMVPFVEVVQKRNDFLPVKRHRAWGTDKRPGFRQSPRRRARSAKVPIHRHHNDYQSEEASQPQK
jgi:hypothetical protein